MTGSGVDLLGRDGFLVSPTTISFAFRLYIRTIPRQVSLLAALPAMNLTKVSSRALLQKSGNWPLSGQ